MTNKNLINYKAQRFQSELNKTTFAYEVKRVRAMWDPTLSIPGTNRRGGWRCPVGTRYGGQITDRFGRNCGWGVARRIANAITNIGERMEGLDDRRRGRRVDRRNRRMMGRLQQNAQAGRAERGLRGVADVLDGGEGADRVARPPRGREVVLDDVDVPEGSPVVLDDGGRPLDGRAERREARKRRRQERRERRLREQQEREARGEPPAGQLGRGWRGVLSEGNRRYNEQGNRPWWGPGQNAPRPDADSVDVPRRRESEEADSDAPRPRRPRPEAERRPRRPRDEEGTAEPTPETPEKPARPRPGERKPPKVPAAGESPELFPGVKRPAEYPKDSSGYPDFDNIDMKDMTDEQLIGMLIHFGEIADRPFDRQGQARRRAWQELNKKNFSRIRGELQRRGYSLRLGNGREPKYFGDYSAGDRFWQAKKTRPARNSDERDRGLRESERRRVRREIEEPGAARTGEGAKPKKRPNRRRAASDEMAAESATRRPPVPKDKPEGGQKKPAKRINLEEEMIEIAEGESMPDSRSFRNVNNRFPKSGLPKSAYWRKPDYDGNDAAELEKRFGRYYDADNNINNRGRFVNKEIERRKREGGLTPKGRKPRKPKAEKKPDEGAPKKPSWLPKEPPKMPEVQPKAPTPPTEEALPEFEVLPDADKDDARARMQEKWQPRESLHDSWDKEANDLDEGDEKGAMELLKGINTSIDFWEKRKQSYRDTVKAFGDYNKLSDNQKLAYRANLASLMQAQKELARYYDRERKLKKFVDDINKKKPETPEAPAAPTPPVVERPKIRPNDKILGPKAKNNDNKLGPVGKDGLPSGKAVPVGNRGMKTKADAIKFVADGGDLADVPDEFVLSALEANAGPNKRFAVGAKIDGGVNGSMRVFVDPKTNKKFMIKYEGKTVASGEDINEIIGNNIAGRLGFKVGEFRFVGPEVSNRGVFGEKVRPIMFEHVENYIEGNLKTPKHVDVSTKMAPADIVGATLLDFLILNSDRHGNNYFITENNGVVRFVPIDPSLGFGARQGGEYKDKSYGNAAGMKEWIQNRWGGKRNRLIKRLQERVKSGEVSRAEIVKVVTQLQDNLRKSQEALAFSEFGDDVMNAAGKNRPRKKQIVTHTDDRIKYIISADPKEIAALILDTDMN